MIGKHIRNERLTREATGSKYVDKELPATVGVTWCGENANGLWQFQDAEHALLSLSAGHGIAPCRACLNVLRAIIDTELGPSTTILARPITRSR